MEPRPPEYWIDQLEDPDPESRKQAILHLAKVREARAIPALRRLVQHDESEDVRYLARRSLTLFGGSSSLGDSPTQLGPDASDEKILAALTSDHRGFRYEALGRIAQKGSSQFLPRLLERVDTEKDPRCRALLASILGGFGNRSVIAPLATFLQDKDADVRVSALIGFINLNDVAAYPYVVRMLIDPDPEVRSHVLKALARLGRVNLLKICAAMLRHEEVWMQEGAVFCLAALKVPEAIPLLESALRSPRPSIRERAQAGLFGLAAGGHEQAKRILAAVAPPALSSEIDKDSAVVSGEIENLGRTIPQRHLASPRVDDRLAAIREIARAKEPNSWDDLSDRLEHETDGKVLASLIQALGPFRDVRAASRIEPFLSHADSRVRANSVEALGMIRPPNLKALVSPRLIDENNRVRANSIVVLADQPGVDVLTPLDGLFRAEDPLYRRSAVWAAGTLGTPQAMKLLGRAVQDPSVEVRARAKEILQLLATEGKDGAQDALEMSLSGHHSVTDFSVDITLAEGTDTALVREAVEQVYQSTISGRIRMGEDTQKVVAEAIEKQQRHRDAEPPTVRRLILDQHAFGQSAAVDLEDPDPGVRMRSLQALGRMSPEDFILGRLRTMAAVDSSRDVRLEARQLVAHWEQSGRSREVEVSIPVSTTAEDARSVLGGSGWCDRLQLIFVLHSTEPDWLETVVLERSELEEEVWVLGAMCRLLSTTGSSPSIRFLDSCLEHADSRVAGEALMALNALRVPGVLEKAQIKLRHESPRVQAAAIRIMALTEPDRALDQIPRLALDADPRKRSTALAVLEDLSLTEVSEIASRMIVEETQIDLLRREIIQIERYPTKTILDRVVAALRSLPSHPEKAELEPILTTLRQTLEVRLRTDEESQRIGMRRRNTIREKIRQTQTSMRTYVEGASDAQRTQIKAILGGMIALMIGVLLIIGMIVAQRG